MATTKEEPTTDVQPVDMAGLIEEIDPQKVAAQMFRRVLEAETLDKAFDVLEGKTSNDFIGRTFTFDGIEFNWYESDRGPIPAAKGKALDTGSGELVDFWTSAQMLVAFLAKAKLTKSFPVTWKLVETTTSSNRKALNFERV